MLQGICINTENTVVLTEGESYYLFPNGTDHYYVSKFPNDGAHTGCFQTKHFHLVEKEKPNLDREKVYLAHMYRKEGYPSLELKEYFINPSKTHCYIYHDSAMTQFVGCFPLDWFKDFEEVVTEMVAKLNTTLEFESNDEEIEFRCSENGQLLLF
ncbi:hypothetical protein ACNRWW_14160 [Metabacillus sp. HB246100]